MEAPVKLMLALANGQPFGVETESVSTLEEFVAMLEKSDGDWMRIGNQAINKRMIVGVLDATDIPSMNSGIQVPPPTLSKLIRGQ